MTTRADHLAWCKTRALAELAQDPALAVASMLSDLEKWDLPLYDPATIAQMATAGMMFGRSSDDVRTWIEGFN